MSTKPELPAPWTPPLTREEGKPAPVQLAENIATSIRRWLSEGWVLASKKRAVEPGDILILLQRRSNLLLPIVRALKDKHVPVAGIDRMVLGEQSAVQDVFSLCRFLLLPEDNLTLAEVLRGPFIRLSDEQLFTLAHGRGEKSLWGRLQQATAHEKTAAYLKHLLSTTDYRPAFTLLNEILFKSCPADETSGQHALVRRLGPDATDPLEQLLAAALLQESEVPSLQLFVQGVMQSKIQSKRDLSKATGQVRILTVHSAKGLEAPIVIIPDLARDPNKTSEAAALLWNENNMPLVSGDAVPLLRDAKDSAKLAELEEHRRLLYVALTRARDVLILCGLAGKEDKEPWHEFCRMGMERLSVKPANGIWRHGNEAAFAPPAKAETSQKEKRIALPEWIYRAVETTGEKRRFVNPSQVAAVNEKILPPVAQQTAFRRGQLLHRLLQMLPEAEEAARENLAYEFLLGQSGEAAEICKKNAQEVMRVLRHPVFAPLFAQGSRAEVPVIGRLEGKRISGQIDRLAVTEKEVLIIDYKTNRPPPARIEDIPRQYRAQMAAYRALLEKIYPGQKMRCALLWTHTLQLMELDEAMHLEGLAILRGA
ncbi:MAG: PD-(D/E)XK nuclease family protein [Proteobacteria bacterium]|nr:PD-(D/E)XK nuclease family protein [Pseudomonadota bacterium]